MPIILTIANRIASRSPLAAARSSFQTCRWSPWTRRAALADNPAAAGGAVFVAQGGTFSAAGGTIGGSGSATGNRIFIQGISSLIVTNEIVTGGIADQTGAKLGTGVVSMVADGAVTLGGANTYTGGTEVNGTLTLTAAGAAGSAAISLGASTGDTLVVGVVVDVEWHAVEPCRRRLQRHNRRLHGQRQRHRGDGGTPRPGVHPDDPRGRARSGRHHGIQPGGHRRSDDLNPHHDPGEHHGAERSAGDLRHAAQLHRGLLERSAQPVPDRNDCRSRCRRHRGGDAFPLQQPLQPGRQRHARCRCRASR